MGNVTELVFVKISHPAILKFDVSGVKSSIHCGSGDNVSYIISLIATVDDCAILAGAPESNTKSAHTALTGTRFRTNFENIPTNIQGMAS